MQKVQNVIVVYLQNCQWFGMFAEAIESLLPMFEKTVITNVLGLWLKKAGQQNE